MDFKRVYTARFFILLNPWTCAKKTLIRVLNFCIKI